MDKDFVIDGKQAHYYQKKTKESDTTMDMLNFILENTNLDENTLVADLAAGSGNYEMLIKDKVKRIDAIDLSNEMIKIMRNLFKDDEKVRVIKKDIADTGLDSDYYDVVLLIMSLHHITNAEPVLEEASRILKPSGRFILIDRPAKDKRKANEYDMTELQKTHMGHGKGHTQRTEEELESLLNSSFTILKRQEMPYSDERKNIVTRMLYCLEKK